MEGLHDLVPGEDGRLYSTQYFGEAITLLDPEALTQRTVRLEAESWKQTGYLTRGILPTSDGFWIGHTRHRGWIQDDPTAKIRHYTRQGKWTGRELELPGFIGVYDIVSDHGLALKSSSKMGNRNIMEYSQRGL
jgi:hypothetical protein